MLEDRVFVGRFAHTLLYEGAPHAESIRDTEADQQSVLLRFYRDAGWTFERYRQAYSIVSGTGPKTPIVLR